jgi:hypothetical protein
MDDRNARERVVAAFAADLELELDSLRKQLQAMQHAVADAMRCIRSLCADAEPESAMSLIDSTADCLAVVL